MSAAPLETHETPGATTPGVRNNRITYKGDSTMHKPTPQEFIDLVVGENRTSLAYAEPVLKADGKISHVNFRHTSVSASMLLEGATKLSESGMDVWFTPCPRKPGSDPTSRTKDTSAHTSVLYADVDHELTEEQRALVDRLDATLVRSGSGNNVHVYVHLEMAVRPLLAEYLNRGLRDALDGDAKWSSDALLRVPGTWNHKARVRGGEASEVVVDKLSSTQHSVSQVAEILGLDDPLGKSDAELSQRSATALGWSGKLVRPVKALRGYLKDYAIEDAVKGSRSEQVWRMVTNALEWGYSVEEIMFLASVHPPTQERAEERNGRWHDDIMRIIDKEGYKHEHTGQTCGEAECGYAPKHMRNHSSANGFNLDLGELSDTINEALKPKTGGKDFLPSLPEEVYEYSPTMRRIRDRAHRNYLFPDALLMFTLDRVVSMTHFGLTIDAGRGPVHLNSIMTGVGATGRGKTDSERQSRDMIPSATEDALQWNPATLSFEKIKVPIEPPRASINGTRQGILDTYMGTVDKPAEDGSDKTEQVRMQVHTAASFDADEGERFMSLAANLKPEQLQNSPIPLIRSLWSGKGDADNNASSELKRKIMDGTRFTATIMVQPLKLGAIGLDAAGGTPQRFLFLPISGDIPPRSVCDAIPDEVMEPIDTFIPTYQKPGSGIEPTIKGFKVPNEIREEVLDLRWGATTHALSDDEHERDSQRAVFLLKITAWITLLHATERIDDEGMLQVKVSDWELAKTIRDTSLKVLDACNDRIKVRSRRESAMRALAKGHNEAITQAVVAESKEARAITAGAGQIGRRVWKLDSQGKEEVKRRELQQSVGRDHAKLVDLEEMFQHAVEQGWIIEKGEGVYAKGENEPPARPGRNK